MFDASGRDNNTYNTRKGILMYVLPEIPAATTAELSLLISWKSTAVMSGEKFSIRTIM